MFSFLSNPCPLCYDLDFKRIARLTENLCTYGETARHWMPARELRASARGVGTASHNGRAFKRPCRKCELLADAVETFVCESGFGTSRTDAAKMKYLVAVDTLQRFPKPLKLVVRCKIDGGRRASQEEFELELFITADRSLCIALPTRICDTDMFGF